jgi:predicted pyridoxine 5'-phosphate oxidase superfamily flavin-nucleotide-binding protein
LTQSTIKMRLRLPLATNLTFCMISTSAQAKTNEMPKTKRNYKDKLAQWTDDKKYNFKTDNLFARRTVAKFNVIHNYNNN